jgi:oxidase EvaA
MNKQEILSEFIKTNFGIISDDNVTKISQRFYDELISEEDTNQIGSILDWLQAIKDNLDAVVTEVPLNEITKDWGVNKQTGNYEHITKGFFKLIGVRVDTNIRESGRGWDQPIVDQGTESSVAGLLRCRKNGVPYYAVEAKFEPGNYDRVLLSPTLQVTYDNFNQIHGGKKPLFSEYFNGEMLNTEVVLDRWYPEDGGRFYLKRVKNMIVEIDQEISIPENFKWINISQLRKILELENIANPHLRSIMAVL